MKKMNRDREKLNAVSIHTVPPARPSESSTTASNIESLSTFTTLRPNEILLSNTPEQQQQRSRRQAEAAARTAFLARLPPVHRQIVNVAPGYPWHRVLLATEDYIQALLSRQAVLTAENQRLREEVERQRKRIMELERGDEDLGEVSW